MNPHVAQGYRECARITRAHGTTYYWGALLLPPWSRRHVYAVYALARQADDLVDLGDEAGRGGALTAYEERFWSALEDGHSTDPVLAAVVDSVRATGIDAECFERFFRAMRMDLTTSTYETWHDLLDYMDGSAAVIGEMMLPVLRPTASAREAARSLGLAFQLTNFLRDVAEDLDRGRVYLPQEDLARFGADPWACRVDAAWRALMAFEIARNRRLYREADVGIRLLPGAARRCVATARVLYARILDRIEAADYDVFSARARVPTAAKAATAARLALHPRPPAAPSGRPASGWNDDTVVLVDERGEPVGSGAKSRVHHDDTPLHLGFSCYVVDDDERVLVTTRAHDKPSFPGVRTNSVCGHPRPGEPAADAVIRRAREELGLAVDPPRAVLPRFRYRAVSATGLVENEVCPVFVARARDCSPRLDPSEVADATWVRWPDLVAEVAGGKASPWCARQVPLLDSLGSSPSAWPDRSHELPPAAAPVRRRSLRGG